MKYLSRFYNFFRLLFAPSIHRRNVWRSRKILKKLREIKGGRQDLALPLILAYVRYVDPYVVEEVILSAFEDKGYFVKRGLSYSGDGGIDGVVYKDFKPYYIQSKRYNGYVSAEHVREFAALMQKMDAQGFFIHTGKTGKISKRVVDPRRVKIISGSRFVSLVG